MDQWNVSNEAAELHRDALFWDMTLPIITPGAPERRSSLFSRAAAAGFDYLSITLAVDGFDFRAAGRQVANYRALLAESADAAVLASSMRELFCRIA